MMFNALTIVRAEVPQKSPQGSLKYPPLSLAQRHPLLPGVNLCHSYRTQRPFSPNINWGQLSTSYATYTCVCRLSV